MRYDDSHQRRMIKKRKKEEKKEKRKNTISDLAFGSLEEPILLGNDSRMSVITIGSIHAPLSIIGRGRSHVDSSRILPAR